MPWGSPARRCRSGRPGLHPGSQQPVRPGRFFRRHPGLLGAGGGTEAPQAAPAERTVIHNYYTPYHYEYRSKCTLLGLPLVISTWATASAGPGGSSPSATWPPALWPLAASPPDCSPSAGWHRPADPGRTGRRRAGRGRSGLRPAGRPGRRRVQPGCRPRRMCRQPVCGRGRGRRRAVRRRRGGFRLPAGHRPGRRVGPRPGLHPGISSTPCTCPRRSCCLGSRPRRRRPPGGCSACCWARRPLTAGKRALAPRRKGFFA